MSDAPLSDIRVIDMSRVLAGPWAGQILADLGAEVIKIERPQTGDDTRHWGPPYLRDRQNNDTETAAYFMSANRGKQSVTVDISVAGGQAIIRDLAKTSDVLIENFKVDGLKKLGLDFASINKINPRLVYCSITGFGQTGPLRHQPGYDLLIQGMGGMMSITGEADGLPQRAGVAVADLSAGLYATTAIQAALLERYRSGLGQHIDLSLLDVQASLLSHQAASYLLAGDLPGRMGSAHPNIAPYQVFETADGHMILAIGNDAQFARFAAEAGVSEMARDDRFRRNEDRVINRDLLLSLIMPLIKEHNTAEWLERLAARSIPAGPINNIAEVFDIPQLLQRDMRLPMTHPEAGDIDLIGNPIKLSRSNNAPNRSPPPLGQHTDDVLQHLLGYTQEKIASLKSDGAI